MKKQKKKSMKKKFRRGYAMSSLIKKDFKRKEIPVFFAVDDNYAPFLAVALQSMIDNASKNYNYIVKVLHTSVSEENIKKISKYNSDYVNIEFVDVKDSLEEFATRLHLTSKQYTQTTYFRMFIPSLYPQYKKALYLDSDIIVREDISKLYNTNIGNKLVGAVSDGFVASYEMLHEYIAHGLGLPAVANYFNAGILVLNLEQFRLQNFEGQFVELLAKYKFKVQDQDYLNIICKDKVCYLPAVWNQMPTGVMNSIDKVKIIHYNLVWKPWHAEVEYGEEFWKYSDKTEYKDLIRNIRDTYTAEMYAKDLQGFHAFMNVIEEDGVNPNNYYYTYVKPEQDGEPEGDLALTTSV